MKCPVDGTTLALSSRDGVEIDYCPECRGVWLDRGELDKILDRASSTFTSAQPVPVQQHRRDDRPRDDERPRDDRYDQPRSDDRYYDDRRHDDRRYDSHRKRKRKNFLEEIFDFD